MRKLEDRELQIMYGISEGPIKPGKKRKNRRNLFVVIILIILLLIAALVMGLMAKKRAEDNKIAQAMKERARYSWNVSEAEVTEEELASNPTTERINSMISGMSLKEKICQLIVVHPSVLTNYEYVIAAGETTEQALKDYPVGGIIYDSGNFEDIDQTTEMLDTIQNLTKTPLFLAVNEEGNNGSTLFSLDNDAVLESMYKYKDEGPEKARENARYIARTVKKYGVNLDLAPVADVFSNPENTVAGTRAYGDSFEETGLLIEGAVKGFHDGGVACTLRHFPGYGETTKSAEYKLPISSKSADELKSQELLPFKAGIDAGADAVLLANIIVPQIDTEPVPFSQKIVTDMLKNDLEFQGATIVDVSALQDAAGEYTPDIIAVKAINAGADILLLPPDLDSVIKAITDAVGSGVISEERINDCVRRIFTVKIRAGLL